MWYFSWEKKKRKKSPQKWGYFPENASILNKV